MARDVRANECDETAVMKQHQGKQPRAKAAQTDRQNEAAVTGAFMILIAGLLIGQLLLLISP
jgi:hypothetical protein